MFHRQLAAPSGQVKVFTVEVLLERSDGSRAHDQKWVVATGPDEAGQRGLASAADRWPGHTIVGVESVRPDHSPRARRYLRRAGNQLSLPRIA